MAKMKRSEIILWVMVALALAANIWLPKHMHPKYSWERDLAQRMTVDSSQTGQEILAAGPSAGTGRQDVRMRVRFSITVPVNTLKAGSTLRCWLPYPRQDVPGQEDIRFIEAGVGDTAYPADRITFSDPSCAHSSLYMEAKASRYHDVTFYEVFEFTRSGSGDMDAWTGDVQEREKHLVFTDRIRALADSLTEGCDTPGSRAAAIRSWVDGSITTAPSRESSTIGNIPEYVLSSGHGNSSQKALLLMTLLRCKGIPAGWESGLRIQPKEGGPFNLVVNNDFGRDLSPEKKYPRSDDVDVCRGEVEWDWGNLYFNQWNYDFQIEDL